MRKSKRLREVVEMLEQAAQKHWKYGTGKQDYEIGLIDGIRYAMGEEDGLIEQKILAAMKKTD